MGVWDYMTEEWVQTFAEDSEFTVDGSTITLDGAKLFEACESEGSIRVFVELEADGVAIASNFCDVSLYESSVEYAFESDCEYLPGNAKHIRRWNNVYVKGPEYPDGENLEYEVVDVSIKSQVPETQGEDVVEVFKGEYNDDETGFDCYWECIAQNFGTATLEVTYRDLNGNDCTYTFNIDVVHVLYDIDVRSESGMTRALPGKSLDLVAQPMKEAYDDGDSADESEEELFTFVWRIADEDQGFATVTPDPNDSSRATVTFDEANVGDDYVSIMEDVEVIVTMYGAYGEDEPVERAWDSLMLSVEDDFLALVLDGWNEDLSPGLTQDVTAELRHYSISSQNEDGYDVFDDVLFTFNYDDEAVEITDSEGNKVLDDEYGDSSRGSSVPFTVKRLDTWNSTVTVYASWYDGEGYDSTSEYFRFNWCDFDFWLGSEWDALFDDGTLDVNIHYDGIAADAYDTVITVGVWDYMTEEWEQTFAEGSEFTVEGSTITLDGAKLFEACGGEEQIRIQAELKAGDVTVAENDHWIELREVLDAVGAAWPAAGVHQERRDNSLALVPPDDVTQVALVVVIRFGHFANLVPIERSERGYPVTNRGGDSEGPHDGAFLVGRAEEHRCRIERQVQRKEEREDANHHEGDCLGQHMPGGEQHEQRDELHDGRYDESLADFLRNDLEARVHGVVAERGAAGEGDIQCDGGQECDCPDNGRDSHGCKSRIWAR